MGVYAIRLAAPVIDVVQESNAKRATPRAECAHHSALTVQEPAVTVKQKGRATSPTGQKNDTLSENELRSSK